jgi:hypothetical protein
VLGLEWTTVWGGSVEGVEGGTISHEAANQIAKKRLAVPTGVAYAGQSVEGRGDSVSVDQRGEGRTKTLKGFTINAKHT